MGRSDQASLGAHPLDAPPRNGARLMAEYTERVIALMTPEQKASLETLRIRLGARSAAEVIRMLIEKEMSLAHYEAMIAAAPPVPEGEE